MKNLSLNSSSATPFPALLAALIAGILAGILTGCGRPDADGSGATSGSGTSDASWRASVATVDGRTTVEMAGNDRMRYNLEAFSVKSGDTVRLQLNNVGTMPKSAMGHNVVFLVANADPNAFVTEASRARDNDYIPESLNNQIVAHTALLGPGESDTIEFTAPEPGEYIFLCSFPGHLYAGMRGIMRVEP